MSFFYRFKFSFVKICCILALGFCFLFVSRSALAQNLVPQAYDGLESGTVALYPIYLLFNSDFSCQVSSSLTLRSNNITFIPFQTGDKSTLGDLRKKQLILAILDYEGLNYCKMSDLVSTVGIANHLSSDTTIFSGDMVIASVGRPVKTTFHPSNSPQDYTSNICLFNVLGYVFYRPNEEVNCYDVFYCLNVTGCMGSLPSSLVWDLQINNQAGVGRIFPTQTNIVVESMKTYQFLGSFSAEITSSKHEFTDTSKHSLPFEIDDFGQKINFCLNSVKNQYWNNWDLSENGNIQPGFSSGYINVLVPAAGNLSNWPLYSNAYSLVTAGAVISYSDSRNATFNHLGNIDTDQGGMKDIREWFLTKHNVLDPADDKDATEEPDFEPELPPAKEAEEVTDIGKDTQERYKYYWDEEVGNETELDNLEPPPVDDMNGFDPPDINLDYAYKRANDAVNSGLGKNQGFKTSYDSTFADLNGDNLSWTFSPAINSPVAYMPLPDVNIDPQAVFDTDYGIYFSIFRACLLLVEFLCFCYGLYKLAISALTGSDDKGDTPE